MSGLKFLINVDPTNIDESCRRNLCNTLDIALMSCGTRVRRGEYVVEVRRATDKDKKEFVEVDDD